MMFYPNKPKHYNRITWVMGRLNVEPDLFYWQAGTYLDFKDIGKGINRNVRDVSKSNVDRIFTEVFGYSSFLDPNGTGEAVIKSEINASHSGRIVELPYKLKEDEVCQRFIDTGLVEYRVLIVMGKPACMLQKTKVNTFNSNGCTFDLVKDVIEADKITLFCGKLGMDYGELDLLIDEKPYIIDANHCVGGLNKAFLSQPERDLEYFAECHRPLFE